MTEKSKGKAKTSRVAAAAESGQAGDAVSIGQQKAFIIENATILNRETKLAILSIVMMEIGPTVVMETGGSRDVDIDLDAVAESNIEVLTHIYNIVQTRRTALSRPAGTARAQSRYLPH
jgi:hypothetical protein